MRSAAQARWIAGFDIEPLMSAILRNGILLSMGLVMGSLALQWAQTGQLDFGYMLQADSVPVMIQKDFQHIGTPNSWSRLLLDAGVAVLMLTTYVRIIVSLAYFAFIDRNRSNVLFTAIVLVILTIVLLTTLA